MTAYAWWEIGSVAAYALLLVAIMIWPDHGDDEPCACDYSGDLIKWCDLHFRVFLEQPVREACELSLDEEIAWQRIRKRKAAA